MIQSEVGQEEKKHMYVEGVCVDSTKMVLKNLFAEQPWRAWAEREQAGEEREGPGQSIAEKYTLSHVKQRATGNWPAEAGAQICAVTPGGGWGGGEGGSREACLPTADCRKEHIL